MNALIEDAARRADAYLTGLRERRAAPTAADLEILKSLARPLQGPPLDPAVVLAELDALSPATVASAGARYFGFVTGGSLPAAMAASILAAAWDQNAGPELCSPVGAALEQACRPWLLSVLGLPEQSEVGFVTGATMANFTGLAAARHALLARQGWDVESQGLFGAPPVTVIVGDEVHVSLLKALAMLGLGRDRVLRIPVDDQGRMRVDLLPRIEGPTIVCIQAGNVNTGAFDPAAAVASTLKGSGAWLHVDGAFGLWAAASATTRQLAEGLDQADSWATDAHKWLNVPYDSGLVFVRDAQALTAAMSSSAAYLGAGATRDPHRFVPEMSRRARAIEIWSALRSLGRDGLAELIDRCCSHARRFATKLREAGHQVLNDVVLNQVLVSFGHPETTRRVIAAVQRDGACWCGGTVWQGQTAMRISVSSWATTEADIDRSVAAILRAAAAQQRDA